MHLVIERRATREEAPRPEKYTAYFVAKCDCGNYKIVERTKLERHLQKSCGCKRWAPRAPRKELKPGDRFGRLTVVALLSPAPHGHPGGAIYRCLCDCKTECERQQMSLHERSSCGCAKRVRQPARNLDFRGRRMSIKELAQESGVKEATLRQRMKGGMTPTEAATEALRLPVRIDVFGEKLSPREVGEIVGIKESSVFRRIRDKWLPETLLRPNQRQPGKRPRKRKRA